MKILKEWIVLSLTLFIFTMSAMHIIDEVLYAGSHQGNLQGVVGFDLYTSNIVFFKQIPGMTLPNGLTSDTTGYLYVTGFYSDKIYKISLNDSSYTILVNSGLSIPNGAVFDFDNNRLLVINSGVSPDQILSVDPESGAVTIIAETNVNSTDGLAIDKNGNTYFSSWATDKVYKYDTAFTNPPEVFSSDHGDPADIFIDNYNNVLAVPNFSSNAIDFIPIIYTGFDYEPDIAEKSVNFSAVPNPFCISTSLNYNLDREAHVKIKIFDIMGKEVKTNFNDIQTPGHHSVAWDGKDNSGRSVPKGTYLCEIQINDDLYSIKILFN